MHATGSAASPSWPTTSRREYAGSATSRSAFPIVKVGDIGFKVCIGEHGFEPLQTMDFSFVPIEGPFIEVALVVDDAGQSRTAMAARGHQPFSVNHIDPTDHDDYLFGPDFHGLTAMVACEGNQEAVTAPFVTLKETPKLDCMYHAGRRSRRRTLAGGDRAYHFGSQFKDLPVGIYAAADDAEILTQRK